MSQIPILMYHSIAETADPRFERYVVKPRDFRQHLHYLAKNRYHTMTLSSLLDGWRLGNALPEKSVVITFDDGFADFYTEAAPLLLENSFTATLFIATGFIGKTSSWLTSSGEGSRQMLTWQKLREVSALGFEVGAHTHSHPELDRCADSIIVSETSRSKKSLEDQLGISVRSFAYPFGYWSKRVRAAVADAGFDAAVQVGELPSRQNGHALSIPRLSVNNGMTEFDLAQLLAVRSTRASRALSGSKRWVWQAARRCGPAISTDAVEGGRARQESYAQKRTKS